MAAATIVFTLSLSSSNALTAERSPVAQITEENEKHPATLYFAYTGIGESEDITAAEREETAIPVFYEESSGDSLKLAETLTKEAAINIQDKEQNGLNVTEQASYAQNVIQQAEEISVQQSEKYTEAEKEMIAKVVYAEARGECFDGRVAVAQTVINRYESGKYGKTLKRVVYARSQFAVSKRYSKACMEAVEYAIENMPYPTNMYYFRVSKSKHWRYFVYYDRIGNHSFYCGKKW